MCYQIAFQFATPVAGAVCPEMTGLLNLILLEPEPGLCMSLFGSNHVAVEFDSPERDPGLCLILLEHHLGARSSLFGSARVAMQCGIPGT